MEYKVKSARHWNGDDLFYSIETEDGRLIDNGMTCYWDVPALLKKHQATLKKFEETGLNRWGQSGR